MEFTPEKMHWLWDTMQQYRTLFSDLTRGDVANFTNLLLSPDSFWVEVTEHETQKIIGILYVTDLKLLTDAAVHPIFFDRKPVEKAILCRMCIEWLFQKFPFQRLSAYIPHIYWMTLRLAKTVGFVPEGRRRQVLLIGGKWVDEIILGILRSEVINVRHN